MNAELLKKLIAIGIEQAELELIDQEAMQRAVAIKLRKAAVNYLEAGKGPVAINFRESGAWINGTTYQSYLSVQSNNGEWGTSTEAAALGELLGYDVRVTETDTGRPPYSLKTVPTHHATSPTIHLYNQNNKHWHIEKDNPKKTLGDNNCLYNAFAQQLCVDVKKDATMVASAAPVKADVLQVDLVKIEEKMTDEEVRNELKLMANQKTQIEFDEKFARKLEELYCKNPHCDDEEELEKIAFNETRRMMPGLFSPKVATTGGEKIVSTYTHTNKQ